MQDIIFKEEMVQMVDQVEGFKQAIWKCVEPLMRFSCVTSRYGDAMIRNVETYGSNFIVSPYVVLPHARPEQGVRRNAISVLITKKPFYFTQPTKPLRIMIVLAPINSKSHLQILQYITTVLNDDESMNALLGCEREEEVYKRFMYYWD